MTIERLERESPAVTRADALRQLFPEAVRDGELDLSLLAELVGMSVAEGPEYYGLTWPGQREARRLAAKGPAGTLRPRPGDGVNEADARDVLIVGDNLEVLRILQAGYRERVKLIYIDPPYNTGNDFIYNDSFEEPVEAYLEATAQRDFTGLLTSNPQSSGRFHSAWLRYMYPRIALSRSLLRTDGFIFVNIDDGEVHNLRMLLDAVFGAENFIANVVWQKKYTRANDAMFFSDNHDHILVYAKSRSEASLNLQPRSDEQKSSYSNPDGHKDGPWKATPLHAKSGSNVRPYTFRNGINWTPPRGTFRRFSDASMREMDEGNEIWFGPDGHATPARKSFLSKVKQGVTPVTIWPHEEVGHNHEANNELKALLGSGVFDNPKPTRLIRRILELATDSREDHIVLDFFAGSGTTGEAVWRQNAEDGGNRQFLLVQLPESTSRVEFPTIDEITAARLRAAVEAIGRPGSTTFGLYHLARSSCVRWRKYDGSDAAELGGLFEQRSGLAAGWKAEDVVVEVMLAAGFPLDAKHGQHAHFAENTVWAVSHPEVAIALLVCLDDAIADGTVEQLPADAMFVCVEAALTDAQKVRLADAVARVRTL